MLTQLSIEKHLNIEFIYEQNIKENQNFVLSNISTSLLTQVLQSCKTLETKKI